MLNTWNLFLSTQFAYCVDHVLTTCFYVCAIFQLHFVASYGDIFVRLIVFSDYLLHLQFIGSYMLLLKVKIAIKINEHLKLCSVAFSC